MSQEILSGFDFIPASGSKINEVDFESLSFGSVFTDYMLECDYKDGAWQTPVIRPYAPFQMDPSSKIFHYAQAIFEGMKAYRSENNEVFLFRPEENFKRLNKSAVRLAMPEVPEFVFLEGIKQLVKLEEKWVKSGKGNALYIRPFMIATGVGVTASPSTEYKFCVILSPSKSYYSGAVKVVIADHYSRAANGGIGAAKAAGNYAGQFYPTKLAQEQGFDQVIWTDDATHTKLEEAGTMNVFFRIDDTLITAPASDRILDGVTRKSLIDLAKHLGIKVEERPVLVSEILQAHLSGSLKEVFGSGTAAVINKIAGFAYEDNYYELPIVEDGYAVRLKEHLTNIQYKLEDDIFGWTLQVM